jgi:opacity protein-like surface antigen
LGAHVDVKWKLAEKKVYLGFVRSVIVASAILGVPRLLAGQELLPRFDELRLGGAASTSDRPISGYAQIEALFSPLSSVTAYDPNFSWFFSPRPLVGANISLQGKTNQAFAGLAWDLPISGPFFAEVSFGGLVHDQTLFQIYPDRPELTTRFLFRESIAVGFEINPNWRIIAFADHGSNGNLGYRNSSINHVGMMLGAKLGEATKRPAAFPPPAVSDFSWAGFFAGISGGVASGKVNAVIDGREPDQSTVKLLSLIGGGHFGYNWDIGALVTGVEADISAQQPTFSATRFGPHSIHISASSHWLATARARIGVAVDQVFYVQRLLLYATGGAAFTRVGKSYCNSAGPNTCYDGNGDVSSGWVTEGGTSAGWTVGGGLEIPLAPHASAKFEYLYASFGTFNFANGPISNSINFSEQILRVGISFGFAGR